MNEDVRDRGKGSFKYTHGILALCVLFARRGINEMSLFLTAVREV